jgi:hypothetical protein
MKRWSMITVRRMTIVYRRRFKFISNQGPAA